MRSRNVVEYSFMMCHGLARSVASQIGSTQRTGTPKGYHWQGRTVLQALLELKSVTQVFGGVVALENVSFDVQEHSITGLIGPNGSGKTTAFNVISGYIRPTSGQVLFRGADITGMEPARMTKLGLVRTFQTAQLFRTLTVRETLQVAASASHYAHGLDDAMRIAREVGLQKKLDFYPSELTTADMQAVELAKAFATGASLIMLDEVFAGLNPIEIDRTVELIKSLKSEKTFLIIEHRMRAVMALCERIHVLVFGHLAASGTPREVTSNPEIIRAYLGEEGGSHA